jgi:hypothetical protein
MRAVQKAVRRHPSSVTAGLVAIEVILAGTIVTLVVDQHTLGDIGSNYFRSALKSFGWGYLAVVLLIVAIAAHVRTESISRGRSKDYQRAIIEGTFEAALHGIRLVLVNSSSPGASVEELYLRVLCHQLKEAGHVPFKSNDQYLQYFARKSSPYVDWIPTSEPLRKDTTDDYGNSLTLWKAVEKREFVCEEIHHHPTAHTSDIWPEVRCVAAYPILDEGASTEVTGTVAIDTAQHSDFLVKHQLELSRFLSELAHCVAKTWY